MFLLVKGNGSNGWENVLIVANEDDTDIYLDGDLSVVFANLAKAGDYVLIEEMNIVMEDQVERYMLVHLKMFMLGKEWDSEARLTKGCFVPPLSCQSQGGVNNIP